METEGVVFLLKPMDRSAVNRIVMNFRERHLMVRGGSAGAEVPTRGSMRAQTNGGGRFWSLRVEDYFARMCTFVKVVAKLVLY
ncbi:MAG: hypothetical protein ACTS41_00850 [Candidatus Hodgkinia cicadicola]